MEQQAHSTAQRAKREQQHLKDQVTRLKAEVAALTEDRYELQVCLGSTIPGYVQCKGLYQLPGAQKHCLACCSAHTVRLVVKSASLKFL